jgi:hypothetical protein
MKYPVLVISKKTYLKGQGSGSISRRCGSGSIPKCYGSARLEFNVMIIRGIKKSVLFD